MIAFIWKTHQQVGFIAGTLFLMYSDVPLFSLTAVIGCIGAMMLAPFPDVDEPNSVAARGAFPLAWVCEIFQVKHRTVTHSVLFCYLLFLIADHVSPTWWGLSWHTILLAWWWGYVSHPLVDLLNPQGVEIFWPMKMRFALLPPKLGIEVGSKTENLIQIVLMFLMEFLLLLWLFKTTPEVQHGTNFLINLFQSIYSLIKSG